MSVTKLYILQEIKRTTRANGGTPLRKLQFESKTGIKRYDWFGVYWARWSDAIREAGYMSTPVVEIGKPQHSKSVRYDRTRTAPSIRLA
jgi:hypothetical protein